jgi:hypothetical protein
MPMPSFFAKLPEIAAMETRLSKKEEGVKNVAYILKTFLF